MQNFSKTFLSETRAAAFVAYLEAQGAEDIEIWGGRDAFGQADFIVRWNLWN